MQNNSISPSVPTKSNPTPEAENVRAFYNKNSINFSRMVPDAVARSHNLSLAARMGIQPGNYIFDAGCGAGIPAIHIAQSFPGTRIEGITISEVEAAEAQIRIAQANLVDRVRVQVGDFHAPPFPDEVFDVVFFNDSIKYSNQVSQVLAAVKRVLRPGGTLYITGLFVKEPPLSPLEQRALDEINQQEMQDSHVIPLKNLVEFVQQAGFQSIEYDENQTVKMPALALRLASANFLHPHLPLFFGDIKAVKPAKAITQNQRQPSGVISSAGQNRHEENLRYIEEHKQIFDIENSDILNLFEEFIGKQQRDKGGSIACGCNIEKDRSYPARFYYCFEYLLSNPAAKLLDLEAFLSFSHHIEKRAELRINRRLLQQFLATGLDPSKIRISFGIDVRPEPRHSRIKLYLMIRNYPEKIAIATALCGEQRDWEKLIVNGTLLVGFDFFFDNRAAVEVYPTFYPADLQRPDVQAYLTSTLPAKALPLIDESKWFQLGISDENDSDVLYFNAVKSPNNFVDRLGNEMVKQVHAHYRNRVFHDLYIGIPESEFSAESIQRAKMYYSMNDLMNKMGSS
jgi:LynF/TruF/PatF family peptide O-prenyltransferase